MIRTIHVGVGNRGRWPVNVLGADPNFESVALVDFSPEFLAAAREKLSLPESACFSSLEDALKAVEADAVVICTPTKTHATLCRQAFAAGKHALVEKGMTMDWEEAKTLVHEAEAAGVKFCVAQNYRYGSIETTIRELLDNTSHPHHPGKVEIVDLIHHRYRPEPRTLNYPFATVWDMSCHHADLLTYWLGEVKTVTAIASNPSWSAYEYDANIAAHIEFESGALCHYVLTHAATISHYQLQLQGPNGTLRTYDTEGIQFYPLPTSQLGSAPPQPCDVPPPVSTEQGVATAFRLYIETGEEPGISGRNNLATLALCEMLVRSATERRPVHRDEL